MLIKAGDLAPAIQTKLDLDTRKIITPNLPEDFFYLSEDFPTYKILNVDSSKQNGNIAEVNDWFWAYKEMLNKKFVYRAVIAKSFGQKWKFTVNSVYYEEWAYSRYPEDGSCVYGGMLFDKTVVIGLCRNTRVVEDLGGYTGLLYAYQKDGESIVLTPNGLVNLGVVDTVDMTKLQYSSFVKLPENVYGLYCNNGEVKYVEI